jgi:hypothetical protein
MNESISWTDYESKYFNGIGCETAALNFCENSRYTIISIVPTEAIMAIKDKSIMLCTNQVLLIYRRYHK